MTGAVTPVHGKRKTKVGRVVSDKMDKTIVVSVERLARHPLYKRVIRLTTRFKAHDELNEAKVGDTVLIEESRPLSRHEALAARRGRRPSGRRLAGRHRQARRADTTEAIHASAHPGRRLRRTEAGRVRAEPLAAATVEAEAPAEGPLRHDPDSDPPAGSPTTPAPARSSASGSWAARRRRRPRSAT